MKLEELENLNERIMHPADEGYYDATNGYDYDNPYEAGTPEYDEYHKGYMIGKEIMNANK